MSPESFCIDVKHVLTHRIRPLQRDFCATWEQKKLSLTLDIEHMCRSESYDTYHCFPGSLEEPKSSARTQDIKLNTLKDHLCMSSSNRPGLCACIDTHCYLPSSQNTIHINITLSPIHSYDIILLLPWVSHMTPVMVRGGGGGLVGGWQNASMKTTWREERSVTKQREREGERGQHELQRQKKEKKKRERAAVERERERDARDQDLTREQPWSTMSEPIRRRSSSRQLLQNLIR